LVYNEIVILTVVYIFQSVYLRTKTIAKISMGCQLVVIVYAITTLLGGVYMHALKRSVSSRQEVVPHECGNGNFAAKLK